MRTKACLGVAVFLCSLAWVVLAQQPARPAATVPKSVSMIFRETFKGRAPGAPQQVPLTPQGVTNANLELKLYGPGAPAAPDHESGIALNNEEDEGRPGEIISYVWSGVTEDHWGVTLKDKNNYVDLRGPAKIRWRARFRSFHNLRLIIKLTDGTMLLADYEEPQSTYWRETEFYLTDIPRWRVLDEKRMDVARDRAWRTDVDLSRVDEIGFTDLNRGAGHGTEGNSGLDWIEVWGNPVARTARR
jgi:hypothetical protein